MRKILLAFAALSALFVKAVEKDEGVLVLNEANFDEELAKHEYLLVEFYAPWCGHCKKLAPEYALAAAELASQDPPISIAKVDATENNALASRFEVQGFPTLYWFVNGQRQDYTGGRTKDTIVQWVNKKTGPPSHEVSCDELAGKVSAQLNLVYFGDFSGNLWDNFWQIARENEKYAVFHASGACAAAHGANANGLSVFRSFDNSPVHYNGEHSVAAIRDWMDATSVPMLIEFAEDYIEPIFGKSKPALMLFANDRDASVNAVFKQASERYQGEILFVVSGTENGIQSRLAEFVGVTAANTPTIRLLHPGDDMTKYVFEGNLDTVSAEDIKAFIDDFKAGKLTQHLKSEEEPAEQGALTVLVGTNFDRIVNDPTKDVFVKFYAPWCGHCKALAPTWEELAESVANVDDLVIAKFDATANEVAGLQIRGYPTLKFYPKDNKAGADYDGDRDLDAFKSWLNDNSSAYRGHAAKAANDEL